MNIIDEKTMSFYLRKISKTYRQQPALAYVDGETFNYEQLLTAAYTISKNLDSLGIKSRDKVIILSENSPWFAPAYLGVTASNRTIVPVLTEFSVTEIRKIIQHSESKAFIVSSKLYKKVESLQEEFSIPFLIADGYSIADTNSSNIDSQIEMKNFIEAHSEALYSEAMNYFESFKIDPQSLCSLIYTSGTTGTPKGVMLSHFNILSNVEDADDIPGEKDSDTKKTLSILPLAHALECTVGTLVPMHKGCYIHYLAKTLSVAYLMASLQKVKPGILLIVPLMVDKIYRKKVLAQINSKKITAFLYKIPLFRKLIHRKAGAKLIESFGGNLYYCGVGGARLAEDTERFLKEGRFPYAIGYGLTETAPAAVGCGAHNAKFRAAGFALPNIDIKIDNPDPKTGEGEILIRGPIVMQGYYKEPEITKSVMTEDNFFKSGDLGYLKDGYLYVCGRSKNVIVSANGENIYPENIETAINSCEFVEESIVYENKNNAIVAKIHLNYEEFKKHLQTLKDSAIDFEARVNEQLEEIQRQVNGRISTFSRIKEVIEQTDPFEKTPKKSIKRYLYTV